MRNNLSSILSLSSKCKFRSYTETYTYLLQTQLLIVKEGMMGGHVLLDGNYKRINCDKLITCQFTYCILLGIVVLWLFIFPFFSMQPSFLQQWSCQEKDQRAFAVPGSSVSVRDGTVPVEEPGLLEHGGHLHSLLVDKALPTLCRSVWLPQDLQYSSHQVSVSV